MYSLYVDDSSQDHPTRVGLGPMFSLGGVIVSNEIKATLEHQLDAICEQFGFPIGEEFKWSPSRKHWMRSHLTGPVRDAFFRRVLLLATMHGVKAVVVAEDCTANYSRANCQTSPQDDAVDLLLERADLYCRRNNHSCQIIIDNPSGNGRNARILTKRIKLLLRDGTKVLKFKKLSNDVMTRDSKTSRLLQLADIITSCSCARICGESRFSPQLFKFIVPMLLRHPIHDQIGGVGLKIHPSKYTNLYHWLCGDSFYVANKTQMQLPSPFQLYYANPNQPPAEIA
ncbi:DUF3800 domain-containing protein [Geothrix campi]|uniref:DUF3800 domain-containing protein n=1 Tax=Geothrix campi TaxID=2966450 RepID=UPI002148AE9A|nr:DUF3800 domain-containing protein [Geothrix sp. SG10]